MVRNLILVHGCIHRDIVLVYTAKVNLRSVVSIIVLLWLLAEACMDVLRTSIILPNESTPMHACMYGTIKYMYTHVN